MRVGKFAVALALTLAVSLTQATAQDHLRPSPFLDASDSSYVRPSAKYTAIYEALRKRQVVEELRDFLRPLHLPREIKLQVKECGAATVPYVSGQPVTVCYELIEQIGAVAKQVFADDSDAQQAMVIGGFIQATLVQTAYAVIDVLQLPVWGRMSDAADALAAFVLVEFGDDMEQVALQSAAQLLLVSAENGKVWTGFDFAKLESPDAQRTFTYLCIAAAGDRLGFGQLMTTEDDNGNVVHKGLIPARRSGFCAQEYQSIRKAFNLRVMPHIDAQQLVEVRATDWLNWKPRR